MDVSFSCKELGGFSEKLKMTVRHDPNATGNNISVNNTSGSSASGNNMNISGNNTSAYSINTSDNSMSMIGNNLMMMSEPLTMGGHDNIISGTSMHLRSRSSGEITKKSSFRRSSGELKY